MRDSRASAEYFVAREALARDLADRAHDRAKEALAAGVIPPTAVAALFMGAVSDAWAWFSAAYSGGASRTAMQEALPAITALMLERDQFGREVLPESRYDALFRIGRGPDIRFYREFLWLISLGIALDVDDAVFEHMIAATVAVHDDRLVGLMIALRKEGFPVSETYLHKPMGAALAKAWDAKDPVRAIDAYLGKWLSWFAKEPWSASGTPEQLEKGNAYFGHWGFETAGIIRGLKLDDTQLLENPFYPAGVLNADR